MNENDQQASRPAGTQQDPQGGTDKQGSQQGTPNPDLQREDAGSRASGQSSEQAPANSSTPAERASKQEQRTDAQRGR